MMARSIWDCTTPKNIEKEYGKLPLTSSTPHSLLKELPGKGPF